MSLPDRKCPDCNGYGRFMFHKACETCNATGTMTDARYIAALSARVAKLEAEQSEARNRVARLEAALTYYADLDAHGARLDVYESNYTGDPADVELDRGAKARAALEPTQSGSERSDEEDKS